MRGPRLDMRGHGLAILTSVVAFVLSMALAPIVEPDPFPQLLLAAVMLSAWYGGLGPGLAATALCLAGGLYLLMTAPASVAVTTASAALQLVAFLLAAILISSLSAALRAARQAAEDAGRRKDEFLALLGHELRNPLAAIHAAVLVLMARGTEGGPGAEQRAIIERQGRRLSRLVDDLLDVSRIASGKVALFCRPVDLNEAAAQCVQSLRTGDPARWRRLSFAPAPAPLLVDGDPARLEQVLTNLLENAVKFTPHWGTIELQLAREGEEAVVRVRDEGIGIPPAMLVRIFEPFTQVDESLARTRGGLGLGLSLVRSLVELHGGRVSAESAGPEQGSEFVVRLPLLRGGSRAARLVTQKTDPGPRLSRRVLVVEDNADAREALCMLLELWGHRVETADDGPRGVQVARRMRPDVALIDIGLPGLDGYQVASQLRALPETSSGVFVALTGYGTPEDRQRALEAGFDSHLVKPVDPDALARLLEECVPRPTT